MTSVHAVADPPATMTMTTTFWDISNPCLLMGSRPVTYPTKDRAMGAARTLQSRMQTAGWTVHVIHTQPESRWAYRLENEYAVLWELEVSAKAREFLQEHDVPTHTRRYHVEIDIRNPPRAGCRCWTKPESAVMYPAPNVAVDAAARDVEMHLVDVLGVARWVRNAISRNARRHMMDGVASANAKAELAQEKHEAVLDRKRTRQRVRRRQGASAAPDGGSQATLSAASSAAPVLESITAGVRRSRSPKARPHRQPSGKPAWWGARGADGELLPKSQAGADQTPPPPPPDHPAVLRSHDHPCNGVGIGRGTGAGAGGGK